MGYAHYNNIVDVYQAQGDSEKAKEYHTKSLAVKLKSWSENHPDVVATFYSINMTSNEKGDNDKALSWPSTSTSQNEQRYFPIEYYLTCWFVL